MWREKVAVIFVAPACRRGRPGFSPASCSSFLDMDLRFLCLGTTLLCFIESNCEQTEDAGLKPRHGGQAGATKTNRRAAVMRGSGIQHVFAP